MPRTIKCQVRGCDWKTYGTFNERMRRLRKHRKKKHPAAHRKSVRKTIKTKKGKGII